MKNLIFRLLFITLGGLLLLFYVFPWSSYEIQVPYSGKEYRLGLDLQGGIELDYKVDLDEAKEESDYSPQKEKEIIEGLKAIVDKRIETLRINDSVITTADYGGEQHIIVQIPLKGNSNLENNENIERAKEAIGKVVKIEFRERRDELTQEDLDLRLDIAKKAEKEIKDSDYPFIVTSNKYSLNYENVESGSYEDIEELESAYSFSGVTIEYNKIIEVESKGLGGGYMILEEGEGNNFLFISAEPSTWKPAKDSKGRILNDKYFTNSSVQFNEAFNPMVELTFNNEGAEIFGELTKRLVGSQIAIYVGGEQLTAPNVNEPILSGRAVITGSYTPEEARELSQNINTGVVPAPIYLTSEKTIDSKLGSSSLEKLLIAGISGFLIIFIFLLFVYRFAGLVASIALFLYVLIVLTTIKSFGVVLTMASVAGLILSIGMAIDANILIFERIKAEIRSGKSLEQSSVTGFKKSWSAIWDSNLTGFIVAMILFVFGINLIKGFGLMLAIGIIVSLFSAMYISRILLLVSSKTIKSKTKFIGIK